MFLVMETQGSEKSGNLILFLRIFCFLIGLISIMCLFQDIYVYIGVIYY